MTLKTLVELWATQHPLILHTPDETTNKRFFLVRNITAVGDFTRSLPQNRSPCILFDLMHDSRYISDGKKECAYTIYFCAKGGNGKPNEEELGYAALQFAEQVVEDFRRHVIKRQEVCDPDYQTIDVNFTTFPYGPLYNGWYALGVNINKVELIRIC